MKDGTPEFSRVVRIDTLGTSPRALSIDAAESERAALAARFGLQGIEHLSADTSITRHGDEIRVDRTLRASVTQSCVATELPVPEEVEEAFTLVFRPEPAVSGADEEIELSENELDVTFYKGGSVDVGEAVAETMSLSLNPYPRSPEAETALKDAGVKSEEEAKADSSPFAALAALKDKLGG